MEKLDKVWRVTEVISMSMRWFFNFVPGLQIQYTVEGHHKMLETMTDTGDSIARVENLLKELADFEDDSKVCSKHGFHGVLIKLFHGN